MNDQLDDTIDPTRPGQHVRDDHDGLAILAPAVHVIPNEERSLLHPARSAGQRGRSPPALEAALEVPRVHGQLDDEGRHE